MFPAGEIAKGGTYAAIVTVNNQIHVHKVKPVFGRLFTIEQLGDFQLNSKCRYILGGGELYFFDQRFANPISFLAMRLLHEYLANKGQATLTKADLMHVRKIGLVEMKKQVVRDLVLQLETEGKDREAIRYLVDEAIASGFVSDKANERLDHMLKESDMPAALQAWLNDAFYEDVIGREYLMLRTVSDSKYRMPRSREARASVMDVLGKGKKAIALVVIDDNRIVVEKNIDVDMNTGTLTTPNYGEFDIHKGTRYTSAKQKVYIVPAESPAALLKKRHAEPEMQQSAEERSVAVMPEKRKKAFINPIWKSKRLSVI